MNAALLLLTACTAGEPVVSAPACPVGCCSADSGRPAKPTFLDRLKGKLKCQERGSHIHCPFPGVIPNTQHPTWCQRIKDHWRSPHHGVPASCNFTAAQKAAIECPYTPIGHASSASGLYRIVRQLRWGNADEILYPMEGVTVYWSEIPAEMSEVSVFSPHHEFLPMPRTSPLAVSEALPMLEPAPATVTGSIPLPLPNRVPAEMPQAKPRLPAFGQVGAEKVPALPTKAPAAASPAKFTPPAKTLDIGLRLDP